LHPYDPIKHKVVRFLSDDVTSRVKSRESQYRRHFDSITLWWLKFPEQVNNQWFWISSKIFPRAYWWLFKWWPKVRFFHQRTLSSMYSFGLYFGITFWILQKRLLYSWNFFSPSQVLISCLTHSPTVLGQKFHILLSDFLSCFIYVSSVLTSGGSSMLTS
jgi:hypothetical protein